MPGRCPSLSALHPCRILNAGVNSMVTILGPAWIREELRCTGLVKLLRRCLTQMSSRARSFIDTCVRFEREALQQASQRNAASPQHAMPDT